MGLKAKKRLRFIGYNLLVVFLILSGMEWYIGAKLNDPASTPAWMLPALRKFYHQYDQDIIQMNPACAHYDSALFYALNSGVFEFNNREFSTTFNVNSAGWRDDEEALNHPKIIVLGDSYTMGWGVEQNETFVQLLEAELGQPVLNTGVSSYGTAREVASLSKVNTDSLEYLIIQYCPNDFSENKQFVMANDSLHISSHSIYNQAQKARQEATNYYFFKYLFTLPGILFPSTPSLPPSQPSEVPEKTITQSGAFIDILKASNKIAPHTKIILFSLEAEYTHNGFITDVKNQLDKNYTAALTDQMSYLDLTGLIDSSHRYILDPHLNAKGHQVVANQLKLHFDKLQNLAAEERVWLYDSGDTAVTCTYENGLKQGVLNTYWETGGLSSSWQYNRGAKHGLQINYLRDGTVSSKKQFRNDVLHGWSVTFDAGTIDSVYFQNGVASSESH